MLCSIKDIDAFQVVARDGEVGKLRDLFFDDQHWAVRHLVVATGGWLSGRDVLVSPHAIAGIDTQRKRLDAALSRKQIEDAPGIDSDKPVSRQQDIALHDHYGYPYWWSGAGMWGAAAFPMAGAALATTPQSAREPVARKAEQAERANADPHLRSSGEVIGYYIEASDGGIGHVEDFLFDDRSWAIRYAIVNTRNWLPGRHVLIAPQWIERISWDERKAHVSVTREAIKTSPPYDRDRPPAQYAREDETRLHQHYRRSFDRD